MFPGVRGRQGRRSTRSQTLAVKGGDDQMFRKLVIAVITAWAALLETVADAIEATLPPPAADSPRLRVVAPGRLYLSLIHI